MHCATITLSEGPLPKRWSRKSKQSFDDWDHRGRLPRGVKADPNADITLFYANNTIYADVKGYTDPNAHMEYTQWTTRSKGHQRQESKSSMADYFDRGYMSVDFGGMRGWENTFHNTVPVGGGGPWFTFGREHWFPECDAGAYSGCNARTCRGSGSEFQHALSNAAMAVNSAWTEMDPDGRRMGRRALPSLPNANGDT